MPQFTVSMPAGTTTHEISQDILAQLGQRAFSIRHEQEEGLLYIDGDITQVEATTVLEGYLARKQAQTTEANTLRTLVVTTATSAVGVTIDQLTIGQTRALVAILLWKAGALTPTGAVKPLNQWVD